MIGYIFVFLALAFGATKGYCGKKTSGTAAHASDAMAINSTRMLLCILIGFFMVLIQGNVTKLAITPEVLLITLLSGIGTSVFTVSWLLAVRKSAYMLLDVFILAGVVIPMLLCLFLYDEPITLIQWIGIAILLIAGYIMCTYNKSINGKMTLSGFVLLILCALSNGITDFSQKLFVRSAPDIAISVFNFYTYVFSAFVLILCCFIFRMGERRYVPKEERVSVTATVKPIFLYIVIMAVCLFLNSYFKTAAAVHLTSVQLYPLTSGSALIISMLMARFLFKEKLNLKAIVGVVLGFAALILINFF
jgi:drug/metabolite transporter (DMT)-like permease